MLRESSRMAATHMCLDSGLQVENSILCAIEREVPAFVVHVDASENQNFVQLKKVACDREAARYARTESYKLRPFCFCLQADISKGKKNTVGQQLCQMVSLVVANGQRQDSSRKSAQSSIPRLVGMCLVRRPREAAH